MRLIWVYIKLTELGGGFIFFNFHPYLGKIPILTNIFRMGWNHQLEKLDEFHHMLPYKPPMVLQETEETKEAEEVEAVPEAGFVWSPCFFFLLVPNVPKAPWDLMGCQNHLFQGPRGVIRRVWCFHRRGQEP